MPKWVKTILDIRKLMIRLKKAWYSSKLKISNDVLKKIALYLSHAITSMRNLEECEKMQTWNAWHKGFRCFNTLAKYTSSWPLAFEAGRVSKMIMSRSLASKWFSRKAKNPCLSTSQTWKQVKYHLTVKQLKWEPKVMPK